MIGMIVDHMVLDLVGVLESELAVRALMNMRLDDHGRSVTTRSADRPGPNVPGIYLLSAWPLDHPTLPLAEPMAHTAFGGADMHANKGDQLVVKGHRIGEPDRRGEVLEARGPGDSEPFMVRWDDSGHVTLLYPGTDTVIEHLVEGRR